MKKVMIILIVVCVAVMIISLGLGARDSDKSRENDYGDMLKSIGSSFDPDPVKKASITGAAPCYSNLKVTIAKNVATPCAVSIGPGDTRVRKMTMKHGSGSKIDVEFQPKGGLPGDKPDAMCLADVSEEDCDECCGTIELRIPEDGADLSVKCRVASEGCNISFIDVS